MRLINTFTWRLEEFSSGKPIPPYAILSHTWGDDEITFKDMQSKAIPSTKVRGWKKVREGCRLAREHCLDWIWIDTCCIDKSSSAELSESINSMFKWYGYSIICFAYLEDVNGNDSFSYSTDDFTESRWFTRGWTLQELLSPACLDFYDSDWKKFGSRIDTNICSRVSAATRIGELYLNRSSVNKAAPNQLAHGKFLEILSRASIAERMCWASSRITSVEEDIAYCLLGIFAVNMPLLYGEGGQAAFRRLQEEIIKYSDDQTIFAWGSSTSDDQRRGHVTGLLATNPSDFIGCEDLVPCPIGFRHSVFSITNKGVHITLPMYGDHALLECHPKGDLATLKTLELRPLHGDTYGRDLGQVVGQVGYRAWHKWKRKTINVVSHLNSNYKAKSPTVRITIREIPDGYETTKKEFIVNQNRSEYIRCSLTRNGSQVALLRIRVRESLDSSGYYSLEGGLTLDKLPGSKHFLKLADGNMLYLRIHQRSIFGEHEVVIDIFNKLRWLITSPLTPFWNLIYFRLMVSSWPKFIILCAYFLLPALYHNFSRPYLEKVTESIYEELLNTPFETYISGSFSIWICYRLWVTVTTLRPRYSDRLNHVSQVILGLVIDILSPFFYVLFYVLSIPFKATLVLIVMYPFMWLIESMSSGLQVGLIVTFSLYLYIFFISLF